MLIGRDGEVTRVVEMLTDRSHRVCPILGPPGIGKTSVALAAFHQEETAQRFGDRRAFVWCGGAESASALVAEISKALGVPVGTGITRVLHRLAQARLL